MQPTDHRDFADDILRALAERRQIPLLTAAPGGLSMSEAYRVSDQITQARIARGEIFVGRKIGFTNKTIWDKFNVSAPICGAMYNSTVKPLTAPVETSVFLEPRIEPEIAFLIAEVPRPGMSAEDLLFCVSDVCAGFEIVQSLFADWTFEAADTVAALGMHGAFLHGPMHSLSPDESQDWITALASFRTILRKNGDILDEGQASNVLGGGPLKALAYLADLIARSPHIAPLVEGELITTGTLTQAFSIAPGQTWQASFEGLPLEPIEIALL